MMENLGHWPSPRTEEAFDERFDERFENNPVQE
jgi:hypothetical protein